MCLQAFFACDDLFALQHQYLIGRKRNFTNHFIAIFNFRACGQSHFLFFRHRIHHEQETAICTDALGANHAIFHLFHQRFQAGFSCYLFVKIRQEVFAGAAGDVWGYL